MRVWVDLSNSPHVELFEPIVDHLAAGGDEVVLTARDHAQTVQLARPRWPELTVIGGPSPPGRAAKAAGILRRSADLARFAAGRRIDVAVSHGSYAQIAAAWTLGIPALTLMDYEFQPANHLSFRLARRVIVPAAFPEDALRRFGATGKTLRYPGYKEELYLAGFEPDPAVLETLGLDPARVLVVLRPPPDGALYHRAQNARFDEVARAVVAHPSVQAVLLARSADRATWSERLPGAIVPEAAVDGPSLLALADLTIGAGGTMNRESALLGTPTYTMFAGTLAAVDAALIREGRLVDLRAPRLDSGRREEARRERSRRSHPAALRPPRRARPRARGGQRPAAADRGSARAGTPATTVSGLDVARDDGAGADERALADRDAAHDHRARADGGAPADVRGEELPVVVALGRAVARSSRAASCR